MHDLLFWRNSTPLCLDTHKKKEKRYLSWEQETECLHCSSLVPLNAEHSHSLKTLLSKPVHAPCIPPSSMPRELASTVLLPPRQLLCVSHPGTSLGICHLVSWTQSRNWASISDNTAETGFSPTALLSIYVWQEKTTLLLKTFRLLSLTVHWLHLRFFFFFKSNPFSIYADGFFFFFLSLSCCLIILYTRKG